MYPTGTSLTRRAKSWLMSTTLLAGCVTAGGFVTATSTAYAQTSTTETIVITGLRQSLQASTEAKRKSTNFSDSVFQEDIGKFPDLNIAESVNRIPGVTLTREVDGEGLNISIRGLGTNFTKILLNGAQVAVASTGRTDSQNQNREVDLDLFPTELFTRLDVNKTAVAEQVEGGVAGVLNMRSSRPFDNPGLHLTYSGQEDYTSNNKEWSPRGSLIASGTWGYFGALLGLSTVQAKIRTSGFETIGYTNPNLSAAQCGVGNVCNSQFGGNGYTIPATVPANAGNGLVTGTVIDNAFLLAHNPGLTISQIDNGLIPRLGRPEYEDGRRTRDSGLAAFEWQFNNVNFYLDMLSSRAHRKFNRIDMDWVGRNGAVIPLNETVDAANVVTSGTFANAQFFLEARPYDEKVSFYNINPGMNWTINDWIKLDGQFNMSRSIFFRQSPTVLVITPASSGITVNYDNTGGANGFPIITSNVDINNPANFGWPGGRVNIQDERRVTTTKGTHWEGTFGHDAMNLRIGVAYDDVKRVITAFDNSAAWQQAICGGGGVFHPSPNTQPGCNGQAGSLIANANLPGYLLPGPAGFITVDYNKLFRDSNYANFNNAAPFSASSNTAAASGTIEEKTTGAFAEVNGSMEYLMGRKVHYNFGVRYFSTAQDITGPLSIPALNVPAAPGCSPNCLPNLLSFQTLSHTYDQFLPSLNAVVEILDNVQLRFAGSRTVTRPDPSAMLPGTTFSDPSAQNANQGNPALAPFLGDNFDFGGEWYTGKEGYFGVALFKKNLTGFTTNGTTTLPFSSLGIPFNNLSPTQQTALNTRCGAANVLLASCTVTVTQQVNTNGVKTIAGYELNWVQPLSWLINGFGFTANYTRISQSNTGAGIPAATGVPEKAYNFGGYYENHVLTMHVTYVYTGSSVASGPNQNSVPSASLRNDAYHQWDGQASYTLPWWNGQQEITFDAINFTGEKQRQTFQFNNATFTYYKPGYSFLIGLRGKF
jgi:TonB-dependent receptor